MEKVGTTIPIFIGELALDLINATNIFKKLQLLCLHACEFFLFSLLYLIILYLHTDVHVLSGINER